MEDGMKKKEEERQDESERGASFSRRAFLRGVAAASVGTAVGGLGCSGDGASAVDGAAPGDGGAPPDVSPVDSGADASLDARHDSGPPDITNHVFVARNGTPVENVGNAIALAGGIQRFVDHDDVVVLKPNGQWPRQGYTHTECMKALIDLVLARPGGFGGEVIVIEHVHRAPAEALTGAYCWNISAGSNRQNNWPDMSYFELMSDYHDNGAPQVTAIPLYEVADSPEWSLATGPGNVPAGQHAWVRTTYTTNCTGETVRLSHPILRSAHSGKLIDLRNGIWHGGRYTGQQVKLIFLPTLNNHGSFNVEDYAGPTSAVKCHLGIVEFAGATGVNLHNIGYGNGHPEAVGESVAHLITEVLSPAFYMTCAEYTGHRGRTATDAAHTRTVGLCTDPVTLDYWMCKYVMLPAAPSQTFMNPDNDDNLRAQLVGCNSLGVGTLDESEMTVETTG